MSYFMRNFLHSVPVLKWQYFGYCGLKLNVIKINVTCSFLLQPLDHVRHAWARQTSAWRRAPRSGHSPTAQPLSAARRGRRGKKSASASARENVGAAGASDRGVRGRAGAGPGERAGRNARAMA